MSRNLLRVMGGVVLSCCLSGCFVRLPSRGLPEQRVHVGTTAVTQAPLSIFASYDVNVAMDSEHANRVGTALRKVADLPKGTQIEVRGLTRRRCPWGLERTYACRAPAAKVKFDIDDHQVDEFLGWPATTRGRFD